jgi:hypothetical protein
LGPTLAESPVATIARLLGGVVLFQGRLGHEILGQLLILNTNEVAVAGAATVVAGTARQRNAVAQIALRTAAPALAARALLQRAEKRLEAREGLVEERERRLEAQERMVSAALVTPAAAATPAGLAPAAVTPALLATPTALRAGAPPPEPRLVHSIARLRRLQREKTALHAQLAEANTRLRTLEAPARPPVTPTIPRARTKPSVRPTTPQSLARIRRLQREKRALQAQLAEANTRLRTLEAPARPPVTPAIPRARTKPSVRPTTPQSPRPRKRRRPKS